MADSFYLTYLTALFGAIGYLLYGPQMAVAIIVLSVLFAIILHASYIPLLGIFIQGIVMYKVWPYVASYFGIELVAIIIIMAAIYLCWGGLLWLSTTLEVINS